MRSRGRRIHAYNIPIVSKFYQTLQDSPPSPAALPKDWAARTAPSTKSLFSSRESSDPSRGSTRFGRTELYMAYNIYKIIGLHNLKINNFRGSEVFCLGSIIISKRGVINEYTWLRMLNSTEFILRFPPIRGSGMPRVGKNDRLTTLTWDEWSSLGERNGGSWVVWVTMVYRGLFRLINYGLSWLTLVNYSYFHNYNLWKIYGLPVSIVDGD